jgi:hypothetical protein
VLPENQNLGLMIAPQRDRLCQALQQVLISPIAKPVYGSRTVHALCHLLARADSPPLPLLSLDRFSTDLMRRHASVGRGQVSDDMQPALLRVLSEHQGIMQAGLTSLEALVSLMTLPLEPRLDALYALDDYACSLTDSEFRQHLSPANFARDLGQLVDKYKNCPQPGMMTLLTLYGISVMPRDGPVDLHKLVLHGLEIQSCNLVKSIQDELNRYADASLSGDDQAPFFDYK